MNILVVTPYYPFDNDPQPEKTTKAIHYFAKEWVGNGNNVKVMHNYINPFFHSRIVENLFSYNKKGKINKRIITGIDGVTSYLLPMIRYIPRKNYLLKRDVNKQVKKITILLKENNFIPDIIVCHFPVSQWEIYDHLVNEFNCPSIITLHSSDISYLERTKNVKLINKVLNKGCTIAFRSTSLRDKFSSMANKELKDNYIIYSGTPERLFPIKSIDSYKKQPLNILYVGMLNKQKNIHTIIEALYEFKNRYYKDFIFHIVGIGNYESTLKDLVKELKMEEWIVFYGYCSRQEVMNHMVNSDIFVMISSPETFGLVYIEAMASNCIVIGSKGEGIDGVIINGQNGFLVKPGDSRMLLETFVEIFKLNKHDKQSILKASKSTSLIYTEESVAERYMEIIKNVTSQGSRG